jgi:predicted nucleic acid-binding protein
VGGVPGRGASGERILVFNSTPLIYLAKAGLADRLGRLPFKLVTTQAVYREAVVKGVEKGVEEASRLESLFESSIIEVVERVDEEVVEKLRDSGVHRGEATVISVARRLNATAVMDDRRARHVARTIGVRLSGTPHIIIRLIEQRAITRREGRRAVERVIEEGWYCSAKTYSEIIDAIEKV